MTGRHRSPPKLLRWLPHIAVLAVVGIAGPPVWLFAVTIGADASAASAAAARDSVSVSTAARSARTVSVPLTVLPAPVPSIGPPGIWDPEAGPSENALSGSESFSGAQVHAATPVGTSTARTEAVVSTQVATDSAQINDSDDETATTTNPPTSPASSTAAATTTSSATTTEEPTPVTTEPTATAEITDVLPDLVIETEEAP